MEDKIATILGGHWNPTRKRYERPVDEGDEDLTEMVEELMALQGEAYGDVINWIAEYTESNFTPNRTLEGILLKSRRELSKLSKTKAEAK